jgi:hypothetical protein
LDEDEDKSKTNEENKLQNKKKGRDIQDILML